MGVLNNNPLSHTLFAKQTPLGKPVFNKPRVFNEQTVFNKQIVYP